MNLIPTISTTITIDLNTHFFICRQKKPL